MSLYITDLENLPREKTLLIHYTINCSGEWNLLQLSSAYRNVCDDEWTVMFPNDQHPRHTDFTISVPASGSRACTFAWNYGGIVGIDQEDFDENHSYLVQLACYNVACSGFTGSGDTSGDPNPSTSGSNTGISPPGPPDRPPGDEPPVPPSSPPGSPGSVPGVNLPPGGGPGGPGNPGGSARTPVNTIPPRGPGGPSTGSDSIGTIDPWDSYYYDRNSYSSYERFDNGRQASSYRERSPVFNNPIPKDNYSISSLAGLSEESRRGNQINSNFNSDFKTGFNLKNIVSTISPGSLSLVVSEEVVHGGSFFSSGVYRATDEEDITLHLFAKDSRAEWFLLASSIGNSTSLSPLRISGVFNSGTFLQGDLTICLVVEKVGRYIGSTSKIVKLYPSHDFTLTTNTHNLPSSLTNKLNLSEPIIIWTDQYFDIVVSGSGSFSSIVRGGANVKYTAFDDTGILFVHEGKVEDSTDLVPFLYSAGFYNKPLSNMTLRIEKTTEVSQKTKLEVYLSDNVSLQTFELSSYSWNGSIASLTFDTPYASQTYHLVVKDKDGSNKEAPTIYTSTSNSSGVVEFPSVEIYKDEIYSLYLPSKGSSISNPSPVFETRF